MYITILGYIMMISLMIILLKGKTTPIVAFIILPIIAGLLSGASIEQLGQYIGEGVPKTLNSAALAIFATLYFRIMTDLGLFDPAVNYLAKRAGGNITAIFIIASIISAISHMDTGMTSTIFVTVPAMMPLFKKFNLRLEWLFLLIAQSVGAVNMLPHGGGIVRVASMTGADVSELFRGIGPIIIIMVIYNIFSAVWYSRIEKSYKKKNNIPDINLEYDTSNKVDLDLKETVVDKKYYFNLILTIALLALVFTGLFDSYVVFMLGLAIMLLVNFPDMKEQIKIIKSSCDDAFYISSIMLASGVLIGILNGTGMLGAIAESIINIIPASLKDFYAVIVGYLSVPLSILIGPDGFYFGLTPILAKVGTSYGFSAASIGIVLLLARDAFSMLTPVSSVTYLAPGLLKKDFGKLIKFSFKYLLIYFTVEIIASILLGFVPLSL